MRAAVADKRAVPQAGASRARDIAWIALLATIVVVPLATSVYPMRLTGVSWTADLYDTPKLFVLRVGVLACAAAWAWAAIERAEWRHSRALFWFLPLLAWMGVSAAVSVAPVTSLFGQYGRNEGLLTWVLYALLTFLTVQLADTAARVRTLAGAIVGACVALSAYGLLQFAGVEPLLTRDFDYAGRSFATAGNPEQLGNLLVIGVPLGVALALGERVRSRRVLWWAAVIAVLGCLVATFTRGAWIAAAVALVLLGVLARRQRVSFDRAVDGGAAAVALLAIAGLVIGTASSTDNITNVVARFGSLFDVGAGSIQTRLELWRIALAAAADRPVFGFGTDAYGYLMPAYRTSAYFANAGATTLADSAHSLWLQLASTIGVGGTLLFGALVGSILWTSGRTVWSAEAGDERIILAGFWVGVIGYLVSASVGTTDAGTAFLFWVACGVVLAPTAERTQLAARLAHRGIAVAAAVVCGGSILASVTPVIADARFLRSATALGPESAIAADRAVALAPYVPEYRSSRARLYLSALTNGIAAALEQGAAVEPGMLEEFDRAIGGYEQLIASSPWDYRNYIGVARFYNRGGELLDRSYFRESLRITDAGVQRFPASPELHLRRAESHIGLDDPPAAKREVARALELDPDYTDAQSLQARLTEGADAPGL